MRKHGQKIVFRAIGGLDRSLLLFDRGFSSPSLRHSRRQSERGYSHHRGGSLQNEQRLIFGFHHKRTKAAQRSPNCDGRKNENAGGGFTSRKPKRGPDHDGPTDKRNRIIVRADRKPAAEDDFAKNHE